PTGRRPYRERRRCEANRGTPEYGSIRAPGKGIYGYSSRISGAEMRTQQTERRWPEVRGCGREAKMCRDDRRGEGRCPNPAANREEVEYRRDRGAHPENLRPVGDSIRERRGQLVRAGSRISSHLSR